MCGHDDNKCGRRRRRGCLLKGEMASNLKGKLKICSSSCCCGCKSSRGGGSCSSKTAKKRKHDSGLLSSSSDRKTLQQHRSTSQTTIPQDQHQIPEEALGPARITTPSPTICVKCRLPIYDASAVEIFPCNLAAVTGAASVKEEISAPDIPPSEGASDVPTATAPEASTVDANLNQVKREFDMLEQSGDKTTAAAAVVATKELERTFLHDRCAKCAVEDCHYHARIESTQTSQALGKNGDGSTPALVSAGSRKPAATVAKMFEHADHFYCPEHYER